MTLSKIYPKSGPFEGGVLVYPFTFEVGSVGEVVVYEGNEVSNNVHSISLHEDGIGGEITLKEISDKRVTIIRKSDFSQEVDFQNNTAFLPEVLEQGLDHTVKLAQELKVGVDRAVKVPLDSDETPEEMAQSLLNAVDDAKRYAASIADSASSAATSAESAATKAQEAQEAAQEAAEAVSADKAFVSKEVGNFNNTVRETNTAINQKVSEAITASGNAVKEVQEVVEGVGSLKSEAVEAIANAKGEATQAIDTAKREAIKEINQYSSKVYRPVGNVATFNELPASAREGDVYHILDSGAEYYWSSNGKWEFMGEKVDLTDYASTNYVDGEINKIETVLGKLDTALDVGLGEVM